MRVLWFCHTPANAAGYFERDTTRGGWLQTLNQELEERVDLHVAFPNPYGPGEFRYGDTTYHSIMPKAWRLRVLLNSVLNVGIERYDTGLYLEIIERVKPDLVHIHGTESGHINILDNTDIPVLVSFQGIATVIFSKYGACFTSNQLGRTFLSGFSLASLMPKTYHTQKRHFRRRMEREYAQLHAAQYVAGRTAWDRRLASVLCPGAAYFTENRILRRPFYENEWRPNESKQLLIHSTTGRAPYKGLETICESLFELNKLGLDVRWNVVGIGQRDPIVRLVKRKLGDRFPDKGLNLLGSISADELMQTMLKSNIYVTASHIENSPNNLAEALIMGMPCIATHAGGTSSYLKDGENGILIQDGDPWALAGSILELSKSREQALLFSRNARAEAMKRHNRDSIVRDIVGTYEHILSVSQQ